MSGGTAANRSASIQYFSQSRERGQGVAQRHLASSALITPVAEFVRYVLRGGAGLRCENFLCSHSMYSREWRRSEAAMRLVA